MATVRCAGRRSPLGCSACGSATFPSLLALELRKLGTPCRRLPPLSPAPPSAQGANSPTRVLGAALQHRSGQARLFFLGHSPSAGVGAEGECPGSGRGVEDRALSEPPAPRPALAPVGRYWEATAETHHLRDSQQLSQKSTLSQPPPSPPPPPPPPRHPTTTNEIL